MNNKAYLLSRFSVYALLALLMFSASNKALSAETENTQINLTAWIGKEGDKENHKDENRILTVAPNEQVILYVDVSTTTWFASGTRFELIELANVLVKQRNTLATNYTTREGGKTWSHQRWEIMLYPQQSGQYEVPSMKLTTEVAGKNNQKRAVSLSTPTLFFNVALPTDDIPTTQKWFSASDVTVEQSWEVSSANDKPSDSETPISLTIGDSVTRKVTIKAKDTLSVLIPSLMMENQDDKAQHQSNATKQYQQYRLPASLNDSQNRGDYLSTRHEAQTYLIQMGGEVVLPSYTFWWWNTKTQQLEKINVEGQTLQVQHTLMSWINAYAIVILLIIIGCGGGIFTFYRIRLFYQSHPLPHGLQFYLALHRKEWATARTQLYRRVRQKTNKLELYQSDIASPYMQESALRIQQQQAQAKEYRHLWHHLSHGTSAVSKTIMQKLFPHALPELNNLPERKESDSVTRGGVSSTKTMYK